MSGFAVVQSKSRTPTIKHLKLNNQGVCAHNALTHGFFIRDFTGHGSKSANSCLAYVIFGLDFPSTLLVSPRLYFASNSFCPLLPYCRAIHAYARRPRPCAVLSCTVSFPEPCLSLSLPPSPFLYTSLTAGSPCSFVLRYTPSS